MIGEFVACGVFLAGFAAWGVDSIRTARRRRWAFTRPPVDGPYSQGDDR